ncbi:MAG: OmpA family protein [Azospirillaceae bacterium]|nr:OmpA family protein [Azospirillaceae bacterium]
MKTSLIPLLALVGIALSSCTLLNGNGLWSKNLQDTPKMNTVEVFFDFERAGISENAATILQQIADSANQKTITRITLSVHTDAADRSAYRQALAKRRADAIKTELVRDGVPADKIFAVDVVTPDAILATADDFHEPQNRRAEIIFQ